MPYKSSSYSPLDIGTDADTDTTQINMGSENLLSFSIFRDGAAEYLVLLLQEDPIAKVGKMYCESLTFFRLFFPKDFLVNLMSFSLMPK